VRRLPVGNGRRQCCRPCRRTPSPCPSPLLQVLSRRYGPCAAGGLKPKNVVLNLSRNSVVGISVIPNGPVALHVSSVRGTGQEAGHPPGRCCRAAARRLASCCHIPRAPEQVLSLYPWPYTTIARSGLPVGLRPLLSIACRLRTRSAVQYRPNAPHAGRRLVLRWPIVVAADENPNPRNRDPRFFARARGHPPSTSTFMRPLRTATSPANANLMKRELIGVRGQRRHLDRVSAGGPWKALQAPARGRG